VKFSLFSKPSLIGLDVQPDAIRLIQLKKNKEAYEIEQRLSQPLADEIFAEDKIKHFDRLRLVLSDLVIEHRLMGQAVAVSLPANLVRMQRIQVPTGLTESEVEAEIHAHLQNDLPGLNDALCMDFTRLPSVTKDYTEVFFAAARKEYLLQYVECVQAAGLQVKGVDVESYALKRAVCFLAQWPDITQEANSILYLTPQTATLIIFHSQEIGFYQHWDLMEPVDFLSQLKHYLQLFLTTFRHFTLQKLLVCGCDRYFDLIFNAQADLKIHVMSLDMTCPHDFLIAYGLAMRVTSL